MCIFRVLGRTLGREEEFRDGINELADGAKELAEGLSELTDNNPALQNAADGASDVQDGMQELKDETEDMLDEIFTADADNLLSFVAAEDNVRIHAAGDDVAMNKTIGMIAGVLLLVLIAYVLSVFVVHSIDQESARDRSPLCTRCKAEGSDEALYPASDFDFPNRRCDWNSTCLHKDWRVVSDAGCI